MNRDFNSVAQKLETYFDQPDISENNRKKKEPGLFTNFVCVVLMATALLLTKTSLVLTRFVKKLEA